MAPLAYFARHFHTQCFQPSHHVIMFPFHRVFCYFILIGQTARLLVKEQSYANTKVLMTKWIIFLFF